jgi:threonine aldolase
MAVPRVVDLRSDTVTRPSAAMRRAMAEAEVGDDVLGDDPTVQRLERTIAELLGKEAALFFPSGIMANQTAVLVQAEPGGEAIIEADGHILNYEAGAAARWAGVQLRPVAAPDNLMNAALVRAAVRPGGRYSVRTTLVCLENTHNAGGGRVLPIDAMRAIRDVTGELGLPVHLDGARLWNASAASGVPERDYAALADTVMVTLSKGLGCPVGSLLAGTGSTMERAWQVRRRLGGGMRQSGILAAAGLHALEHHRARLVQDHENARLLASLAGAIDGVAVVEPQTNIVMIDLPERAPEPAALIAALAQSGVLVTQFGPRRLRAVTHLDVDGDAVRFAADALARLLNSAQAPLQPGGSP